MQFVLTLLHNGSDAIEWHADDRELFEGTDHDCRILSLSLGEERCFEIRPRNHDSAIFAHPSNPYPYNISLASGDLCSLEGLAHAYYEHRIPKSTATRAHVNLTWRWITKHSASCSG